MHPSKRPHPSGEGNPISSIGKGRGLIEFLRGVADRPSLDTFLIIRKWSEKSPCSTLAKVEASPAEEPIKPSEKKERDPGKSKREKG